jgi:hypothetical protein
MIISWRESGPLSFLIVGEKKVTEVVWVSSFILLQGRAAGVSLG